MDNRKQVEHKTIIKLKDKEQNIFLLLNYFVDVIYCLKFFFWLRNMCIACKIAKGGGWGVREGFGMAQNQ